MSGGDCGAVCLLLGGQAGAARCRPQVKKACCARVPGGEGRQNWDHAGTRLPEPPPAAPAALNPAGGRPATV